MKSKGFTIVELLAVIVILSVIMAFTIPGIMESSKSSKEKTYQTKMYLIESGAVMYGQDHYRDIVDNVLPHSITIGELAEKDYLDYDNDKTKTIEDPRGKYPSLNNCRLDITIDTSTRKVEAKLNDEDTCKATE